MMAVAERIETGLEALYAVPSEAVFGEDDEGGS